MVADILDCVMFGKGLETSRETSGLCDCVSVILIIDNLDKYEFYLWIACRHRRILDNAIELIDNRNN